MEKDITARDKIIFGKYRPSKYKFDNNAAFEDMPLKTLTQLVVDEYIDLDGTCGSSPRFEEIYEFMKRHPDYTCHGYTTMEDVVLQGVEKKIPAANVEEFKDYMATFVSPDRMNEGTMWCLYYKG